MSPLELDRAALLFLRTHGHPRPVEVAVGLFSRTGEHAALWFAVGAAGAAFDLPRRSRWLRGLRILAAAYALNYAVKLTVRRPRPQLRGLPPLSPTVSGLSFPSAHATSSFAAARAFTGLLPSWLAYSAAASFAVSRPYLGVHYPSDVLAGAVIGFTLAGLWPPAEAEEAPA